MTLVCFQNVMGREVAAPLPLDRRRRRLSSVVRSHADGSRQFIVSVHRRGAAVTAAEDSLRVRKEWRNTLVAGDTVVLITYLPLGGGGGGSGKKIGMALAAVALAVAAPWAAGALAPMLGLGTAGTQMLAAGLVIGGGMLLSMGARARANKTDDREVYGVSSNGNLPRPGDRILRLYGRRWVVPDLSQADFSMYEGDGQVLYKRLTASLGKVRIYAIRVGDRMLWTEAGGVTANFPGAEIEIIQPGAQSALVPNDVATSPDVGGIQMPKPEDNGATWTVGFPASPVGVSITRIQLDWSFPGGIYRTDMDTGETRTYTGHVYFEYAPIGPDNQTTGPWVNLFNENASKKTQKPIRRTQIVDVPEGRYAVRARQFGRGGAAESRHFNEAYWDALRGHRRDLRTRPNVTEIGIKVRASEKTGNIQIGDIQVDACAILPVWNGTTWVEQETRKAVWAYLDVLRNAIYGGAMPDTRIDAETPRHYATTLSAYDTFDGVIRGPVSVYDAASTILGVMRAEPIYIGRIWSMVRDEPKSAPAHLISARQVLKGSTTVTYETAGDDGSSDIIVEFDRDGDANSPDEVRITYGIPSITPQRKRLAGVREWAHATHLARWIAACGFYRRKGISVGVEHEGRILQRGDGAKIPIWFLDGARAFGYVSRAGMNVRLDDPVTVVAGSHAVLRRRDGLEWGPVAITQGSADTLITLNSADVAAIEIYTGKLLSQVFSGDTQDPTTVLIGQLAELSQNYLIKEVRPSAPNRNAVTAVNDHPAVWAAVGETIPAPPPLPSSVAAPLAPVVPWVRAHVAQAMVNTLHYQVGVAPGAIEYRVEMAYNDAAAGFTPEWQRIDAGGPFPYGLAQIFYDGEQPQILVRAWAIGPTGLAGPIAQTVVDALPPIIPPPAPGSIGYPQIGDVIRERDIWWQQRTQRIEEMVEQLAADVASGNTGRWKQSQSLRTEVRASTDRAIARISQAYHAGVTDDSAFASLIEELTANLSGDAKANMTQAATAFRNSTVSVNSALDANAQAIADVEEGVEVIVGNLLAEGKIRFTAVSGALPADVAARIAIEVRAGTEDNFAFAGMYLDAIATGGSRIVFKADQMAFGDAAGLIYPIVVDAVTGKMFVKRQESFDGKMVIDFEQKFWRITV